MVFEIGITVTLAGRLKASRIHWMIGTSFPFLLGFSSWIRLYFDFYVFKENPADLNFHYMITWHRGPVYIILDFSYCINMEIIILTVIYNKQKRYFDIILKIALPLEIKINFINFVVTAMTMKISKIFLYQWIYLIIQDNSSSPCTVAFI